AQPITKLTNEEGPPSREHEQPGEPLTSAIQWLSDGEPRPSRLIIASGQGPISAQAGRAGAQRRGWSGRTRPDQPTTLDTTKVEHPTGPRQSEAKRVGAAVQIPSGFLERELRPLRPKRQL